MLSQITESLIYLKALYSMFDDLDDSYGVEEDEFCGISIYQSKLKIVESTIPEELYHLEQLVSSFHSTCLIDSSRLPASLQKDQIIRRICNILWAMRPKPEFYTVFSDDGFRYVAVDGGTTSQALNILLDSMRSEPGICRLMKQDCVPSLNAYNEKYVMRDKLFIWKDGKLLKTYFTYKGLNNNLKNGPEDVILFRQRLNTYSSVVAIDVEAFEWDQSILLEVGISEYFPHENRINSEHFIVKENEWRRNGSLVDDHRDCFMFGQSKSIGLNRLLSYLRGIFSEGSSVCLVAHNAASDIKYLAMADPYFGDIPNWFHVYDTQYLHKELRGREQPGSLETILQDLFGKTPQYLHNAGNDAHYTLCAMLFMAGLDMNI